MHTTLEFPELLRLIDERSTAFRAVVASAPSLDVQVSTCPGWTLFDLVQHLGVGRRKAYHATEGRSWRLRLSGDGARIAPLPAPAAGEDPDPADAAAARGTASDLVLVFYGRLPLDSLKLHGDRRIFERLVAWEPDA